jgi:hypothetical protein
MENMNRRNFLSILGVATLTPLNIDFYIPFSKREDEKSISTYYIAETDNFCFDLCGIQPMTGPVGKIFTLRAVNN